MCCYYLQERGHHLVFLGCQGARRHDIIDRTVEKGASVNDNLGPGRE